MRAAAIATLALVLALLVGAATSSPQRPPADAANPVHALWESFVSMLSAQGMTPPLVVPRFDQQTQRGLVLTQAVKRGDRLASIPKKVKLSLEGAAHSPLGKVFANVVEQGMSQKEALALYLLYELHRKDGPPSLAAYFDLLPATFDVPLFFDAADQAHFQGTVLSLVGLQRASVERIHGIVEQICKMPIGQGHIDCAALTLDEVQWAYFVVHSRSSTDDGGNVFLQPLSDMFRTSAGANAGAGVVSSKAGRTVVTALRDMEAGEEVFLAVSDSTAGTHYATTGTYSAEHRNFLALEFAPATYEDTGDVFTATVTELQRLQSCFVRGVPAPRFYIGQPLPEPFLACLRLVHLSPQDFAAIATYEAASEKHWPEGKRYSLQNELDVLASLARSMTRSLASYATTADADRALLAAGGLSVRATEAIRIRLSEKELLAAAAAAIADAWAGILRYEAA